MKAVQRQIVIVAIICIGCALPCAGLSTDSSVARTRPAASRMARSQGVDTLQYDFGRVWAGDEVTHTFEVANPSDQRVVIQSVGTTCGCLSTGEWDKQIPPKSTWKITVKLDTANRRGRFSQEIRVRTGDAGRPEIHLVVIGQIKPRFDMSAHGTFRFGEIQSQTGISRTMVIYSNYDKPVTLSEPTVDSKSLSVALRAVEPGRRYELTVTTQPPLTVGPLLNQVTVQTNVKEQPELTLPVYGKVQPRVMLFPAVIMIQPDRPADSHKFIQLRVDGDKPLKVTNVAVSDPKIAVRTANGEDGNVRGFEVIFPKDLKLPGAGQTLTVHTDDALYPRLTCTFRPLQMSQPFPTSRPITTRRAEAVDQEKP